MKDRAVTIYAVYLQVGYAYCIELETFEDQPMVLKPYETYHKNFGPIEFYAVGDKKVDLNAIFEDRKVRKRLVLSTGDGRYVVPSFIPRWHPIGEMFRNNFFGVIRPVESRYKDKFLGGQIRFVIELKSGSDSEIIPIHPRDFELKMFKDFSLTQDALASKDTLHQYLEERRMEGTLTCDEVLVHDVDEWRVRAHEFYKGRAIVGRRYSWWTYHLIGRGASMYQALEMKCSNRQLQKASRRRNNGGGA